MGKVESALREEIARLARKELRAVVGPLKKEVIRLKKRVVELSSKINASEKQTGLLVKERRRKKLRLGIAVFEDDKRVILDVGDAVESKHRISTSGDLIHSPELELAGNMAIHSLCDRIGAGSTTQVLACRIVVAFHEGCTRRELSRRLNASSREIREAFDLVKENATAWADAEGIVGIVP